MTVPTTRPAGNGWSPGLPSVVTVSPVASAPPVTGASARVPGVGAGARGRRRRHLAEDAPRADPHGDGDLAPAEEQDVARPRTDRDHAADEPVGGDDGAVGLHPVARADVEGDPLGPRRSGRPDPDDAGRDEGQPAQGGGVEQGVGTLGGGQALLGVGEARRQAGVLGPQARRLVLARTDGALERPEAGGGETADG